MKFKSKKLAAFCCAFAILTISSVPAFAVSHYWSGDLPIARNEISLYHGSVTASAGTQHTYIKVNYLEPGSPKAYFDIHRWDNHNSVSDAPYLSQGGSTTVTLYQHFNKGAVLELRGGNDRAWTAGANGYVDFDVSGK